MKNSPRQPGGSRKGKVPEDWSKQGFQLPKHMMKRFRELSGEYGHGGVKILGTAAVSLLLALDEEDRNTLCKYVFQKTHRNADELEEKRVLELLKILLNERDEETAKMVEPVWYVDKIVDRELSPEPGKKWSDRHPDEKDERKKGG